jgi:ribosomal protein S18 acetylase RimI-like enzyme
MVTLISYHEKLIPWLAPLQPSGSDLESLRRDLNDSARGHGTQVVVAVEAGLPCGAAGWVSYGIETQGILYGAPVLAGTEEVACALLGHLVERARALGAHQLRVGHFPGEDAKARALEKSGFLPLLDLIGMERSSNAMPEARMPAHLRRVPLAEVDWDLFASIFNKVFADVPNAPPADGSIKREEWQEMDREASHLWADDSSRYVAWIGVDPNGYVEEIGVEDSLRGQGLAGALYRITGQTLAARGVLRLHTLLASTNAATLKLHEKLGFKEFTRRTVYVLNL